MNWILLMDLMNNGNVGGIYFMIRFHNIEIRNRKVIHKLTFLFHLHLPDSFIQSDLPKCFEVSINEYVITDVGTCTKNTISLKLCWEKYSKKSCVRHRQVVF